MVEKVKENFNYKRNRESQANRKKHGTMVEHIVKEDLKKRKFPKVIVKTKEGVDLIAKNGVRIAVEVKSALSKTKTKNGFESGRFVIKKKDCEDSDIFAFVEKKSKDGKWHNHEHKIKYVRSNVIKKFLEEKGIYKTGKSTKIGLRTLAKLPNAKLHY